MKSLMLVASVVVLFARAAVLHADPAADGFLKPLGEAAGGIIKEAKGIPLAAGEGASAIRYRPVGPDSSWEEIKWALDP